MRVNSLMVGTAVAVGLLVFDVSAPTLTGATAEARSQNNQGSAGKNTTRRYKSSNSNKSFNNSNKNFGTKNLSNSNKNWNSNKNLGTSTGNKNLGNGNKNWGNANTGNKNLGNKNWGNNNTGNKNLGTLNKNTGTYVNIGNTGKKINNGPGTQKFGGFKPIPGKFVNLGGKNWPLRTAGYRFWWKNGWRKWLPLTAIGVVAIGGSYYWANSYVAVARPYCAGTTPDGCQLNWQYVGFEEGDGDYQCVQFCPRASEPAPVQAVAMVTPPPAPAASGCQLTIYAEPSFAGQSAPTGEDQPRLEEVGWKDQISSVKVESGTWDFFAEDDFAGDSMRLAPGPYAQLAPEWNKKIGSFMCVQGN